MKRTFDYHFFSGLPNDGKTTYFTFGAQDPTNVQPGLNP